MFLFCSLRISYLSNLFTFSEQQIENLMVLTKLSIKEQGSTVLAVVPVGLSAVVFPLISLRDGPIQAEILS